LEKDTEAVDIRKMTPLARDLALIWYVSTLFGFKILRGYKPILRILRIS